jgi:GNAT superfamily N-acetyltransferase
MKVQKIVLTKKNTDLVDKLDRVCFPADAPYPCKEGHWWVVKQAGEPIAYAGLKVLPEGAGFFCRAGVLKAHSGKGIHRRLIKARLRQARLLGLPCVVTYTVATNPKSMNNLIKAGFTLYNPANRYAGNALYWRRDLKKD